MYMYVVKNNNTYKKVKGLGKNTPLRCKDNLFLVSISVGK